MRYKYRRLVLNVVLYEKKLGPILPLCQLLWCVTEKRGGGERQKTEAMGTSPSWGSGMRLSGKEVQGVWYFVAGQGLTKYQGSSSTLQLHCHLVQGTLKCCCDVRYSSIQIHTERWSKIPQALELWFGWMLTDKFILIFSHVQYHMLCVSCLVVYIFLSSWKQIVEHQSSDLSCCKLFQNCGVPNVSQQIKKLVN